MPLGKGIRYRVGKRGNKLIRYAFRGNTVVEAKEIGEAGEKKAKRVRLRKAP